MPIQEYITPGEILEIKLQKEIGFAYLKYIHASEELMNTFGRFFLLLNIHSNVTLNELDNKNLKPIICYLSIGGAVPFKGKNKLKRVAIQSENSYIEKFIHRGSRFSINFPFDENEKWWIMQNNKSSIWGNDYMPLNKIRHLSKGEIYSIAGINSLLTMIWIRRLGGNILDIYSEQEMKDNQWLVYNYRYAKDIVFLDTIPEEFWFKPLP